MKTLVKLGMALGVATILHSTTAFAQTKSSSPRMEDRKEQHAHKFEAASKRLGLTGEQQTKIKDLLATNRTEMKAWKESNKEATKDAKRTAMITQMKKLDGQIISILDSKQQTIYQQMKAEKKTEMQEKRAERMKEREEMDEYLGIF